MKSLLVLVIVGLLILLLKESWVVPQVKSAAAKGRPTPPPTPSQTAYNLPHKEAVFPSPEVMPKSETASSAHQAFSLINEDTENPIDAEALSEKMEMSQVALHIWEEEKNLFYREELNLEEKEIAALNKINEEAGEAVHEVVRKITDPEAISDDTFQTTIKRIQADHERKTHGLLGQDRFDRMLAFRNDFSADLYARFGVEFQLTGF